MPPTAPAQRLVRLAQAEIAATLTALPMRLQSEARRLPVAYEAYPNPQLQAEGIEPDTLGLFVGNCFTETAETTPPAHIILYLDNIWDMVGGEETEFRGEVRTTYLHELGHYLGLDELDLEERGLE